MQKLQQVLNILGNPENKIKNVIHVAGTNGKGSTISFLNSILLSHNKNVACFTSPHLVKYNERISLNNKYISNKELSTIRGRLNEVSIFNDLIYFEKVFCEFILFCVNHIEDIDFVILETGIGGRYDPTNIFTNPILNIITSIGYDHMHILGNTISSIANNKAGIIKSSAKVIIDSQHLDALNVIKNEVKLKNTSLWVRNKDFFTNNEQFICKSYIFNLKHLHLQGEHQKNNCSLALAALIAIDFSLHINKTQQAIKNTHWQGRYDKPLFLFNLSVNKNNIFILDGAHNQLGVKSLINTLLMDEHIKNCKIYIFLMISKIKDLSKYMPKWKKLHNIKFFLIQDTKFTNLDIFYNVEEIEYYLKKLDIPYEVIDNLNNKINYIYNKKFKKVLLFTGSLYFIGELLKSA